ncbi:MAG TPA: hypothetical protein DCM28_05995 [Phycisphaerales bacterium]|nr:hypothetical protein [Phycisphaerales bacterium]HCD32824.1 hypothetical protein [Phycisphaerales bacterium]|tara:strand:+ start:22017 stop:22889 length:873 start_codon:yes stop_codon:yes gene_type:complete
MSAYVVYMPENPQLHQIVDLIRSMTVQTIFTGKLISTQKLVHEKTVDATIVATCLRGRYEITHSEQTWNIRPGETFVAPSNTPLRIVHHLDRYGIMEARWAHLHITLYGSINLLGLYDLPGKLSRKKSEPVSHMLDSLESVASNSSDRVRFENLLVCQQCAVEMALHLMRLGQLGEDRIKRLHQSTELVSVFKEISQHLDRPISIDDLCRWAHLSSSRLHVVFQNATGMSPIRYVLHVRLSHARQRLVYTNQSVSQIAHSLAFASPFHFSRVFKNVVGMSPRQYREQNSL